MTDEKQFQVVHLNGIGTFTPVDDRTEVGDVMEDALRAGYLVVQDVKTGDVIAVSTRFIVQVQPA